MRLQKPSVSFNFFIFKRHLHRTNVRFDTMDGYQENRQGQTSASLLILRNGSIPPKVSFVQCASGRRHVFEWRPSEIWLPGTKKKFVRMEQELHWITKNIRRHFCSQKFDNFVSKSMIKKC